MCDGTHGCNRKSRRGCPAGREAGFISRLQQKNCGWVLAQNTLRCGAQRQLSTYPQLFLAALLFNPQLPHTTATKMETDTALTLEAAIQLRFPPFPTVPDGVELIPFHAFRPSGIRVPIDDDGGDGNDYGDGGGGGVRRVLLTLSEDMIERDGMGIPTIPLRVKHAADNLEKKKKKKKKGGAAAQQHVQVAPERPRTWWELWEELEDIRRNAYDA